MQPSPLAPKAFAVMAPVDGVTLATAASGMKYRGRDDVMLISCDPASVITGVFTKSDTAAPPVQWCRQNITGTPGGVAAIITNAGNANAFTGSGGSDDVASVCAALGSSMNLRPEQILMASTGVIGEPLDTDCLIASFDQLLDTSRNASWEDAANAIRTTDTFAKGAAATCVIDGKNVQICGIAKGSGMIAPDMATMLGYIATDAAIAPDMLNRLLRGANQRSFNAITVDSDSSTNDSVFLIATGKAGNAQIDSDMPPDLPAFCAALDNVMQDLAKQVVRDGEGATKFITIDVTGAADNRAAHIVAMSIANSPLVKTAIAGEDANWGRIIMAIGKAGANIDQSDIAVTIGGIAITKDGARRSDYDEAPVAAHMKTDEIDIAVSLGNSSGEARVWTCDLTHGYIEINADYRS